MSTNTEPRQKAKIVGDYAVCPFCGSADIEDIEDLIGRREVYGIVDGVLRISACAQDSNEGVNPRLECVDCREEFDYPDDIQIDYVFDGEVEEAAR